MINTKNLNLGIVEVTIEIQPKDIAELLWDSDEYEKTVETIALDHVCGYFDLFDTETEVCLDSGESFVINESYKDFNNVYIKYLTAKAMQQTKLEAVMDTRCKAHHEGLGVVRSLSEETIPKKIIAYIVTDEYMVCFEQLNLKSGVCPGTTIIAYESPEVALLQVPIRHHPEKLRIFKCETKDWLADIHLNGELHSCDWKLTEEIRPHMVPEIPEITDEHRVRYAIECSLYMANCEWYEIWAIGWLNSFDRSRKSADAISKKSLQRDQMIGYQSAWEASNAAVHFALGQSQMVKISAAHAAYCAAEPDAVKFRGLQYGEFNLTRIAKAVLHGGEFLRSAK